MLRGVLIFALGLSILSSGSGVFAQNTEFKLAVLTELTGAGAAMGQECRHGAEIARRGLTQNGKVAGTELRLIMADSQDDAKVAVTEFKKLVQYEGADAVLVSRSKTAMPLNPLSKQLRIPLVASAGHPAFVGGNPYAFRVYLNAGVEGSFLAGKVFGFGVRRAATVTVEDEWNLSFTSAFARRFQELGGSIIASETLIPSESEFHGLATRLKGIGAEGIFVNLQIAQAGPFIRRLYEQGVKASLFANYWVQKQEVQESAGKEALEGLRFNEIDFARPKFLAMAKNLFPAQALTPATYICYVGTASIIQALKNNQGKAAPVTEALAALKEVTLLDDVLAVEEREVQYPQNIRVIHGGKSQSAER